MLNLLFPAYCFHCDAKLEKLRQTLCAECQNQLTLLPPQGRCAKCFGEIGAAGGVCQDCRTRSHALKQAASCFESFGPIVSLLREYKRGRVSLARDLAAFMAIQIHQLNWLHLDLIIPVPFAWEERLWQGIDPHRFLADALSKWVECPSEKSLKKNAGYRLAKKANFSGKSLLLVASDLSEMESCAEILQAGGPKAIYALSIVN